MFCLGRFNISSSGLGDEFRRRRKLMAMEVFKFRAGRSRDLDAVERSELWAAKAGQLNDPFEARFTVNGQSFRFSEALAGLGRAVNLAKLKEAEAELLKAFESFVGECTGWGVCSMSRSLFSQQMWAHYADSHQGFCLQFNLDLLLGYQIGTMEAIPVNYAAQPPELGLTDIRRLAESRQHSALLKKVIGTKSTEWGYEEEMRIVTNRQGLYRFNSDALEAVYFGCRCSDSLRSELMRRLKGRGVRYFGMDTSGSAYRLRAVPVEDRFAGAQPLSQEPAEVDAQLLAEVSALPDAELLLKAIGIARRAPCCRRVVYADSASDDPETAIIHIELLQGLPQTHDTMRLPKARLRGEQ